MTGKKQMIVGGLLAATVAVYALSRPPERRAWITIPAGRYTLGSIEASDGRPPRARTTPGFRIQRTEVTVAQFVRYLNRADPRPRYDSPQIVHRNGRYRALAGRREPVSYVSHADARGYAEWMDGRRTGRVRLPTSDEWEIAARGGVPGIRYPWGWAPPDSFAQFDADGAARVARHPPNTVGLYDMAGNVAEWCVPEAGQADAAYAMGGSWAERDPDYVRVFQRTPFPLDYRDADVGFRLIEENQAPADNLLTRAFRAPRSRADAGKPVRD